MQDTKQVVSFKAGDVEYSVPVNWIKEVINHIAPALTPNVSDSVQMLNRLSRKAPALSELRDIFSIGQQEFHDYVEMIADYYNTAGIEISLHNDIKKDLIMALEKEEFFLCYQPIIDSRTKNVVSLEALIRWNHPKKGIISPGEFILIAEKTGLIMPIGEWVLKTSCNQLKKWHDIGYSNYGLSVNISAIQLQQNNFADVVSRVLFETGLLPRYLELEITESAFLETNGATAMNLVNLSKQGVRISIDDFGTGYNSLKYLQNMTVDSLKIDRTFIFNIKAHINKVIIDTIVLLGHRINAEVIAEGVELEEQYEYLKSIGCDKIQGYYFSKPLLPEEVIVFLKNRRCQ